MLPGPDGPLPLLILDQRPEMAVRSGPAERVKLFVSVLRSMGLTLVTTISEAGSGTPDVIEVGEPLAPAPGWRLELSARRAARLTAPDGPDSSARMRSISRSPLLMEPFHRMIGRPGPPPGPASPPRSPASGGLMSTPGSPGAGVQVAPPPLSGTAVPDSGTPIVMVDPSPPIMVMLPSGLVQDASQLELPIGTSGFPQISGHIVDGQIKATTPAP